VYMRILSTSIRKFKYVTSTFRWFSIAVERSTQISYGRRPSSYKYPWLVNERSLPWFSGVHCCDMLRACVCVWSVNELKTESHFVSVVTIRLGICVTSQAASMGSHWGLITSHARPSLCVI
jgi:hypothetical protein